MSSATLAMQLSEEYSQTGLQASTESLLAQDLIEYESDTLASAEWLVQTESEFEKSKKCKDREKREEKKRKDMYKTAEKVKKSADDLMKTLKGPGTKEAAKEAKELKKSPEGQQLK